MHKTIEIMHRNVINSKKYTEYRNKSRGITVSHSAREHELNSREGRQAISITKKTNKIDIYKHQAQLLFFWFHYFFFCFLLLYTDTPTHSHTNTNTRTYMYNCICINVSMHIYMYTCTYEQCVVKQNAVLPSNVNVNHDSCTYPDIL